MTRDLRSLPHLPLVRFTFSAIIRILLLNSHLPFFAERDKGLLMIFVFHELCDKRIRFRCSLTTLVVLWNRYIDVDDLHQHRRR